MVGVHKVVRAEAFLLLLFKLLEPILAWGQASVGVEGVHGVAAAEIVEAGAGRVAERVG